MCRKPRSNGHIVDIGSLPDGYPTTHLEPEFWEALGRAVATFGFLEEVLGKAIFAMTATELYEDEGKLISAFEQWNAVLEKALSDQLGRLITSYEKEASKQGVDAKTLTAIVAELREATTLHNVLCHGSWRAPDDQSRSVPLFVNRNMEIFDTPIDIEFLQTTQRAVAELASLVVNTVTSAGWQFPGSKGPGQVIGG